MNSGTLLASDIDNPLIPILFLAPIILGLICLLIFAIKRPAAQGPSRNRRLLILGLIPTIFGAFLILMFATTRGGAPGFFYIVAALPLLVGLRILANWHRSNRP